MTTPNRNVHFDALLVDVINFTPEILGKNLLSQVVSIDIAVLHGTQFGFNDIGLAISKTSPTSDYVHYFVAKEVDAHPDGFRQGVSAYVVGQERGRVLYLDHEMIPAEYRTTLGLEKIYKALGSKVDSVRSEGFYSTSGNHFNPVRMITEARSVVGITLSEQNEDTAYIAKNAFRIMVESMKEDVFLGARSCINQVR